MRADRSSGWPEWLRALGPDPFTRERVRRRILAEAAGMLRARRAGSWWSVADRWTTALLPLAAALALVFATLAHRATLPGIAETPPTVDELLESANPNAPPPVLTSATEPGLDQLLSAAVTPDSP